MYNKIIQPKLFKEEDIPQNTVAKKWKQPQEVKNLSLAKWLPKDDNGMPIIKKTDYIPKNLTAFHELSHTCRVKDTVRFCISDILFERFWNNPQKYLDMLMKYKAVMSPDFSTYIDMDYPYIQWNVYRNRLIGSWLQSKGIIVIPTITWAGVETYDVCFSGVEKGGVVAVGSCPKNTHDKNMWMAGFREMVKRLGPSTVIIYGNMPNEKLGVPVVNFENPYINRLRDYGRVG